MKRLRRSERSFQYILRLDNNQAMTAHVQKIEKKELDGVDVFEVTPKNFKGKNILIYIHGGAYTLGSADHLSQVFAEVADKANLKTYAINYRLAPEHPFPAGLDDCLKVYKALLKTHQQAKIFLLGDSSGGALALSMLLKAREERLAMPTAIGLFSPMAEAEKKGDTLYTHEGICPVLIYELGLKPSLDVYVPKNIPLDHPYISPINANFKGFPPTMITTGTRDLFQSTCARLEDKMSEEGVDVKLKVTEGMGHGFQQIYELPEAHKSRRQMAEFFLSVSSSSAKNSLNETKEVEDFKVKTTEDDNAEYAEYIDYLRKNYIDEEGIPCESGLAITFDFWKRNIKGK